MAFAETAARLTSLSDWNRLYAVTIFFDLEKAYDATRKHGILRDADLRGRMPDFIAKFLSNRQFRVRIGNHLSDTYDQEMGVPQGCILSVTLFILKVNGIVQSLPADVRSSLCVDDFLICYQSCYMPSIERKLQMCLNKTRGLVRRERL